MVLEKMDIRTAADDFFQRLLDDMTCSIGGMDDPPFAVTAFAREVITGLCGLVPGEGNALIDQPVDGFTAMFDNETGGDFIAQSRTCRQGILDMFFDTVQCRIEYGGNPALCKIARAFPQGSFADQRDTVRFGKTQGNGQTRQSTADNNDIEIHDFLPEQLLFLKRTLYSIERVSSCFLHRLVPSEVHFGTYRRTKTCLCRYGIGKGTTIRLHKRAFPAVSDKSGSARHCANVQ